MTDSQILANLNDIARADFEGDCALADCQPMIDAVRAALPGMPPICRAWPMWAMLAEAAPRNLEKWRRG